jgi:hypothetical protein
VVKQVGYDLASSGFGVPWGHTRSYSNQLTRQTGGANGNSWVVAQWPYVEQAGPTTMCVMVGTINEAVWFDLVGLSYVPRFGVKAQLVHDSANQQFVYTDQRGLTTKFFDQSWAYPAQRGRFKSLVDLGGHETSPTTAVQL